MEKLTKPIILDTGLMHRGDFVSVAIQPSENGGDLVFRNGLKRKAIPLHQILSNVVESRPSNVCAADWVDLAALETAIMIYAEECEEDYPLKARSVLYKVTRGLRDKRRADRGEHPVVWAAPRDEDA